MEWPVLSLHCYILIIISGKYGYCTEDDETAMGTLLQVLVFECENGIQMDLVWHGSL